MKRKSEPILPVSLLLHRRPCLVVGGGTIAAVKIRHLLRAEGSVTVICPEAGEEVRSLAEEGRLSLELRPFEKADLEGAFLVYAATSDKKTNARVVALCRERNILCCAVDASWPEGDFVTPAVIRSGSLSLAVSTGGRSCRRSRIVKEHLKETLEQSTTAELLIIGTSHQQLDLARREPFHLADRRLEDFAAYISRLRGVYEFMVLNTCNRVELIALCAQDEFLEDMIRDRMGFGPRSSDPLESDEYYLYRGMDAFAHLNELCAGLLSQTPGENHIVAQLKEAAAASADRGWSSLVMKQWIDTTLHVSRHIRKVSSPLLRQVELEDICVEYLERNADPELPVLIVGTGMIGRGLKERFASHGRKILWCYHQRIPELAEGENVELVPFDGLAEACGRAGCVLCATGSDRYILNAAMADAFDPSRPIWLLDLSLPRNIDPELASSHRKLIDLDDLKHWFRREAADWETIDRVSRKEIEEHVTDYEKIIASFTDRSPGQPSLSAPD